MVCNDCKKPWRNKEPGFATGTSYLAGGEYYNGPPICERCSIKRREDAIAEHEACLWNEDK